MFWCSSCPYSCVYKHWMSILGEVVLTELLEANALLGLNVPIYYHVLSWTNGHNDGQLLVCVSKYTTHHLYIGFIIVLCVNDLISLFSMFIAEYRHWNLQGNAWIHASSFYMVTFEFERVECILNGLIIKLSMCWYI